MRWDYLRVGEVLLLAAAALTVRAGDVGKAKAEERAVQSPARDAKPVGPQRMAWATGFPRVFERNVGQTDNRVRFLNRGPGYSLFLTDTEAVFTLVVAEAKAMAEAKAKAKHKAKAKVKADAPDARLARRERPQIAEQLVLRIEFVGAVPTPRVAGMDRREAVVHQYIGADPAKWRSNIPTYARVAYRNLYPGIDLVFRTGDGGPAYDLIVAPRARPESIRLRFRAAQSLSIDRRGDLIIRLAGREIRQTAPRVYQEINGRRVGASGRYVVRGEQEIGFVVGDYDRTRPLIIDPTLVFAAAIGGTYHEGLSGLAVDAAGNPYAAGYTTSSDFPVLDAPQPSGMWAGRNAFVLKLRAEDGALAYVTWVAGSAGHDSAHGIAVDGSGQAYVTGGTSADDFPVTADARQPMRAGLGDAFVVRLNDTGQLGYSSYLGGSSNDSGNAIAVDSTGIYVAGATSSSDLRPSGLPPTIQPGHAGGSDAFVTKLSLDGQTYVYFTYLGGSGNDHADAIAVNSAGEAHIVGETGSVSDFPTCSPPGPTSCAAGGVTARSQAAGQDAFVAKLDAPGSMLLYSTLLGGDSTDGGLGIALDAGGNAYAVGYTISSNFQPLQPPSPATLQSTLAGSASDDFDGFLTKLQPDGAVEFSTYIGATSYDYARAVSTDPVSGLIWIAGYSWATPSWVASENSSSGSTDAYMAAVRPDGSALPYWRFIGGSHYEYATALVATVESGGISAVYVGGNTGSLDFPFAIVHGSRGQEDIFIAKFTRHAELSVTKSVSPDPIQANAAALFAVEVRNTGVIPLANVQLKDVFDGGKAVRVESVTGGAVTCFSTSLPNERADVLCEIGALAPGEARSIQISAQAYNCGAITNTASAFADGLAAIPTATLSRTAVPSAHADVQVSIGTLGTPQVNQVLTHNVTVANAGPDYADAISVTVGISGQADVIYLPIQCALRFTGPGTKAVDCPIAGLNPGAATNILLELRPTASTTLNVSASASAACANDDFPVNNQANRSTVVP